MKSRTTLPLALTLAVLAAGSAGQATGNPPQAVAQPETINGIVIRHGIERLSYVSPRYFGIRPAYDACMKQSQGGMPKQQDCAETELTYQEGRLNRATRLCLQAWTIRTSTLRLRRSERGSFFATRTARAARVASDRMQGPATESTCRMESTAYRAQQLENWRSSIAVQPPR